MKALTIPRFGSPDVLQYQEVKNPVLKTGEIMVQMNAIGLNFADLMRRNGTYPMGGAAPYINGYEGAGVVIDSNHCSDFKTGDRVAFADVPFANAELVAVPSTHAVPLPESISFETGAAIMLQGLTAQYLTSDSHKIAPNENVLIHAAAGGVGQLLTQVARVKGANVIALVSNDLKQEIALSMGAHFAFSYKDDWESNVKAVFPNGADVVYDSVGSTMGESIAVTRIRGQVVLYGLAGGKLELGDPLSIIGKSITITGGDLWDYLISKRARIDRATELFSWIISGKVKISPPTVFKLSEGRQAHEFMESRKSTGKILLIP
jgi:NADPH2:quinone reductase